MKVSSQFTQGFRNLLPMAAMVVVGSAAMLQSTTAFAQTGLTPNVNQLADIVEDLLPSVVNVDTRSTVGGQRDLGDFDPENLPENFRDFMERMQPQMERQTAGAGSGFIVSDEFIVTNHHVIEDADEVVITLHDGTRYDADVWAADPATDLAVLKIDAEGRDLVEVEWGSSQDTRVGEWLIAIGNPFGIGSTVTAGIVSAKGRSINSGPYDQFIQTDASINRGNSGGPSFNIEGEVVGVNSAIFSPNGASVGIGFAIPSRIAQRVVEDLIDEREVVRGFIGVSIGDLDQDLAEAIGLESANGAIVRNVGEGGPAALAGVEPGDVIIGFNGLPVAQVRDLTTAVAETRIGSETQILVVRNGEERTLNISVARRTSAALASLRTDDEDAPTAPEPVAPVNPLEDFGLKMERLSANELDDLGFGRYQSGLRVVSLEDGAVFNDRDLRVGDIIVELDQDLVTDEQAFAQSLANSVESDANLVTMIIVRDGQRNWIAPRIQK